MKKELFIAYMLLGNFTYGICQAPLAEYVKEPIVRIETPGKKYGTGLLILSNNQKTILITNKHVISSRESGQIWDSIFVRVNEVSPKGRITAKEEKKTIHLRTGKLNFYVLPNNEDMDLAAIPITLWKVDDSTFVDNRATDVSTIAFEKNVLLTRDKMDSLKVVDGKPVFMLGYSFQPRQGPQYLISRYGHIGLFTKEAMTLVIEKKRITSDWIIIDIISRRGDSGGPIFIEDGRGKAWIIGISIATNEVIEIGIAIPSYYILDLLEKADKLLLR